MLKVPVPSKSQVDPGLPDFTYFVFSPDFTHSPVRLTMTREALLAPHCKSQIIWQDKIIHHMCDISCVQSCLTSFYPLTRLTSNAMTRGALFSPIVFIQDHQKWEVFTTGWFSPSSEMEDCYKKYLKLFFILQSVNFVFHPAMSSFCFWRSPIS